MALRCGAYGHPIGNDRQEGDGCPQHTDLVANGGSSSEVALRSHYPDRRGAFPYGRYCCSFCRWEIVESEE